MKRVLTARAARDFDSHIINDRGIPGLILMEDAANAVCEHLLEHIGDVLILCGTGNNGGDGFALLRQLNMSGRYAAACLIGDSNKLHGDALTNYNAAVNSGCDVFNIFSVDDLVDIMRDRQYFVLVDAIFGTGLDREIKGLYADVIDYANTTPCYRTAVDIPSGISADSGMVLGTAFMANSTVTFQTLKRGHLLYPGRSFCGEVTVAPIACEQPDTMEYFPENVDMHRLSQLRFENSFKNSYGKVLIIGGCEKYAGAAVMAATAAQRAGAGLVKAVCSESARNALLQKEPEIMSYAVDTFRADDPGIDESIRWADVTAFGMGAGRSDDMPALLEKLLRTGKKTVIDADGLNCLSENRNLLGLLHDKCVLTPHVGEFARLTGRTTAEINANFPECASEFAKKYGAVLMLKSATSVTAMPDGTIYYNTSGNTGLAKGGSGDMLSGLIAGIAAQGMPIGSATYVAARFQGLAAEICELPEQVMTAADIADTYSRVFEMLK